MCASITGGRKGGNERQWRGREGERERKLGREDKRKGEEKAGRCGERESDGRNEDARDTGRGNERKRERRWTRGKQNDGEANGRGTVRRY